jgi:DNA-binding PadR family transcriptional regulator
MSAPLTLLGLLERGPSHGYDLKRDYDVHFGQGRPLRYSQVYATPSRLARDGKAVAGPVEQGAGPERRRYIVTDEGVADVESGTLERSPIVAVAGLCTCTRTARMCPIRVGARPAHKPVHNHFR